MARDPSRPTDDADLARAAQRLRIDAAHAALFTAIIFSLEGGVGRISDNYGSTMARLGALSREIASRSPAGSADTADRPCSTADRGGSAEVTPDMQAMPETPRTAGVASWLKSVVGDLPPVHLARLASDWRLTGRAEQRPPPGDWRVWLLMGGRGSGKTRAGAHWVHDLATAPGARPGLRIALVAETLGDAREVMIDGVSGICRVATRHRPEFEVSRRRLVWPNGTIAQIFSSEDPESLRGPQFDYAWCDELGKWKHAQATFDMLQFALRLGADPRILVTTTPRPIPILKALAADPATVLRRIRTADNAGNLAPGFLRAMDGRYGGTRLGRQELDGEMIADREDALWNRAAIEALTLRDGGSLRETGPLGRIVVAVDPPAGSGPDSCCGIVVAGIDGRGRAVVLADCSVEGASPAGWAAAVVRAFRRFDADRIVAEINQGGDMVAAVLRGIDARLPITNVRASRGKWLRAEPVAALYEQGRVVHAGAFPALEDQMCDFGAEGLSSGRSPDRLDALVWALTALMLDGGGEPRLRMV
ncbi:MULTISPECIES: terminase family protein [unclassified Rhizobium]|uniref:DNA-packaging protein n=1 Tax=unclassified Rhizobium TaxID=2613769 RepID=UPI001FCD9086|nr:MULTISPECIES: terminase family protein [unclassified Rhizobium]